MSSPTLNRLGFSTSYNILNLPNVNTLSGGTVSYVYDATGNKLRRVSTVGTTTTTDYVSGIQYTNAAIDFIQTETGRALNSSGSYAYQYNLTDNLGNARLSFNNTGTTIQQDDYLPFGYDVNVTSIGIPKNQYLYKGKELQTDLGLYDYGARLYDPVIAKWTSVDPLAEDFEHASPYNYALNNPILMIDQDGMAADSGKTQTPLPKPKTLNEVTITAHKTAIPGLTYDEASFPEPMRLGLRADLNNILSKYTEVGQVALIVSNVLDWGSHIKLSKTGTPRRKTAKQLKKEWEEATGKKWPKESGNPDKDQVAHHIKPLADGGEDGYPNIEPKPAREHIDDHMLNGDFKRWGSKRP